jgi:hypothetical protein
MSATNSAAWADEDTYAAWVKRFGPSHEWARVIAADPLSRLGPLAQWLPPLKGCTFVNLLGSHGTKAMAAALLGAHATVVDVSPANARYGLEMATSLGIDVRYVVADVLQLQPCELSGQVDI